MPQQPLQAPLDLSTVQARAQPAIGDPYYCLAQYAATIKLHKQPIKMRFLTLAYDVANTPMSQHLNALLNGLVPDIFQLWHTQISRLPVALQKLLGSREPLILSSSSELPDFLQRINHLRRKSGKLFSIPAYLLSYDITRLYTSLDQNDLVEKLVDLIQRAWKRSKRLHVDLTNRTASWTDSSSAHSGVFTKQQVIDLLTFCIKNTKIVIGDKVFLQQIGIPMGANYGVVLANLYLFAYELAFLTQLTDYLHRPTGEPVHLRAAAKAKEEYAEILIQELSCLKRYIDDIFGVDSPTIFKLGTSVDQKPECFGFHGHYPPSLQLELTGQGPSVDFLDVTISCSCLTAWDSTTGTERPANYLVTKLFDKRRTPAYASLRISRYPDISSDLIASSKFGIFTSQFKRYNRIITDFPNFVVEVALLLYFMTKVKQYPRAQILRRLRSCCHTQTHLYGQAHSEVIRNAILRTEARLASLAKARNLPPTDVKVEHAYEAYRQCWTPTGPPRRFELPR